MFQLITFLSITNNNKNTVKFTVAAAVRSSFRSEFKNDHNRAKYGLILQWQTITSKRHQSELGQFWHSLQAASDNDMVNNQKRSNAGHIPHPIVVYTNSFGVLLVHVWCTPNVHHSFIQNGTTPNVHHKLFTKLYVH